METHYDQVRAQYDPASGTPFYRQVMGDGALVIHYGIYDSPDTTMLQATGNSTNRLLEIALDALKEGNPGEIIDLGSGPGGTAHFLAQRTQANVTCVDLCPHHHSENQEVAKSLGLCEKIHTWIGSFEAMPIEWSEKYDLAWSQEAFCHSANKLTAFKEARRILKQGGVLVFSDILLAEHAPHDQTQVYSSVNAVARWTTIDQHMEELKAAGFKAIRFHDWTPYLGENFKRMLAQIRDHEMELLGAGVRKELLERFTTSLEQRIQWKSGSVLKWGAFCCHT